MLRFFLTKKKKEKKNHMVFAEAVTVWEKKHIQIKISIGLRSLVGLYEFICMFVCTKRGSPPKSSEYVAV